MKGMIAIKWLAELTSVAKVTAQLTVAVIRLLQGHLTSDEKSVRL